MAREIITKIWCDPCMEEEKYVEASETPPITIGSLKPRVLALCEVHMKGIFEPLREALQELGQIQPESRADMMRMPGTSPGSGIFPCPVPTCTKHTKPYKHEQSLRNHARDIHGSTIIELREKYADVTPGLFDDEPPVPDEVPPPAVLEAPCDQPGCETVYKWPENKLPVQALGVHKARKHGIRSPKAKVTA